MADATGILSKMGVKSVGSWAAAYAAVDTQIPYVTEGITQAYTYIENNSLDGGAGMKPHDQGVQALQGPTSHHLDYNNFGLILEAAFGAVAGGVYTFSADNLNKWLWLEFEKQVSRWRIGAAKIQKLVITGEAGGVVNLNIDWECRDVDRNATAFPAISTTGLETRVRMTDLVFRAETVASGPPGGGDEYKVNKFELEIDNALVPDDYATQTTAGDQKFPLEPIRSGFRVCTLKLGFARYAADTWHAWKDADTAIQADAVFTRGGESITLDLPELRITGGLDSTIGGPERIQNEVELRAYMPASTNPLYTGGEVRLTVV